MKLIKESNFNGLSEITAMVQVSQNGSWDKADIQPLIDIDESHYIGAFLTTTEMAPISADGLKYNLIHNSNIKSFGFNAEVCRVPLGVYENEAQDNYKPKAFKFYDKLIYEGDGSPYDILLFKGYPGGYGGSGYERAAIVTGLNTQHTDKLILLTDYSLLNDKYHKNSKYPHRFDKSILLNSTIAEFNTLVKDDILGLEVPNTSKVPSAFSAMEGLKSIVYDSYLDTSGCDITQDKYEYQWKPIYRRVGKPTIPAFESKLI